MDVHPVDGILRAFEAVPDPRRFNVTYNLPQLLTCTLMAVLCRCDDYEEIAGWVALRHAWLADLLGMPAARTPCRKTFERLYRSLDPTALTQCFIDLTEQLAKATDGRLIAIDGKTLRGSFDHAHRKLPIHLVHAFRGWDHANGLMLGQVAVDDKSNEITAVPRLLELIDVEGAVVSLDAMHCQKQTAKTIRQGKADYLLAIKDNQPTLHEDVKLFFDDAIEQGDEQLLTHHAEPDNGHGRLDQRVTHASGDVAWLRRRHPHWLDLHGVVCVQSTRLNFATGKPSSERRYYMTSLDPREVGAARLGELVRHHWSIENNLHWCLDVSFGDDASRLRKDHGPENFALIKRHSLGLVKRSTPPASTPLKAKRMSLKTRRFHCGLDDAYLIKTLLGGDQG